MKSEFIGQVKNAGIVGAGGAGFPTHVKLNLGPEILIANCAECEPLLECDKVLLRRHPELVAAGLAESVEELGAARGVFAVKRKNADIVGKLKKAIGANKKLSVFQLDDYYPAGDEQQVVYEVTGRHVPPGGLPVQVGALVLNAATLRAVAQRRERPMISRYVTVCGEVERPGTYETPVGTPVRDLIDLCGGATCCDYRVIIGGPAMGRLTENPDGEYVAKTTGGVVVLPADSVVVSRKSPDFDHQAKIAKSACCQCNYCTLICPRNQLGLGVHPNVIMQAVNLSDSQVLERGGHALGCCDCGLCTFVGCSMGLAPGRFTFSVRQALLKKGVKPDTSKPVVPDPMREFQKMPSERLIARMGLTKYSGVHADYRGEIAPRRVRVLLRQHVGKACAPAVRKGDAVRAGDLVGALGEGDLGAPVHASISGTVTAACGEYVEIAGGGRA